MHGGTFNLLTDRNPKVVKIEVDDLVHEFNLKYLAVQESSDYAKVLDQIKGYTYFTGGSTNEGAQREVGLLIRNDVKVTNVKNRSFGDGWVGVGWGGIRMAPRNFLEATLDGSDKVATVHFPPGTDLESKSPEDRYEDYIALSNKIERWFKAPSRKSRLVAMDANVIASENVFGSPRYVANQSGAKLSSPDNRIDYVLTKGLHIDSIRKLNDFSERSDHNPVIYSVHRDK